MRGLLGTQRGLIGDRDRRALLADTCAAFCCAGGAVCRFVKFVWCCYPEREPLWLFLNERTCPQYSAAFETIPTDIPRTYNIGGNCYTTDPTDIRLGEQVPPGSIVRGIRVGEDAMVDNCVDPTCAPCPECCGSVIPEWGCNFQPRRLPDGTVAQECCECGDNYIFRVHMRYEYSDDVTVGAQCDITQSLGEFTNAETLLVTLDAEVAYECEEIPNDPGRYQRKVRIISYSREITQTKRKLDATLTCCAASGPSGLAIVGELPPIVENFGDAYPWIPPQEACGMDDSRFMDWFLGRHDNGIGVRPVQECSGENAFNAPPCPNGSYTCFLSGFGFPPFARSTWSGFRSCEAGSLTVTGEGVQDSSILARVTSFSNGPNCGCSPECGPYDGSMAGVARWRSNKTIVWEKTPGDPCTVPPCETQQALATTTATVRRPVPSVPKASQTVVAVPVARSLVERALEGL